MLKKVLSLTLFSALFAASVSAAGSVSGLTDGGTLGKTNAWGSISLSQGGLFSNDSASGSTGSDAAGDLAVGVFLHYATASSGDNVVEGYNSAKNTRSVSTSATAPNDTGTYVNGGHVYSSSNYGSWSGGTNLDY